jgi:hypothetical protein
MYGKVFESMYEGTLADDWEALVTFQQMIVLADADGVLDMTAGALSRRTGIPREVIEKGLAILEAPDPASRTPDKEGRRIERLDEHRDWGWRLVNHAYYRGIANAAQKRGKEAERKRQARQAKTGADRGRTCADRGGTDADVSASVRECPEMSAHTDTDTETDTNPLPHAGDPPIVPHELKAIWQQWSGYILESQGRRIGSYEAEQCLKALSYRGPDKAARDVEFSILKGAKSLLDSDDDFSKQRAQRASGGRRGREAIDVDGLEL